MKGQKIILTAPRQVELVPFAIPKPGTDEVLVRNEYSVISAGTERANLVGLPNTLGYPQEMGYNSVGIVLACGADVRDIAPGDRVLVYFGGGHRTHSVLKAANVTKVPVGVPPREAPLVILAGMGLQGARKTRLELGESAMVVGLGLLGMFAVQCMRWMGGLPVIAMDFDETRLALARELGADCTLRPDDPDLRQKVLDITHGKGVDAVVEVTGSAQALVQVLSLAAREGRISLTGCTRVSDAPIDFYQMVHKPGVQLIGAHTFVRPAVDSRPGYWTHRDDHRVLLDMVRCGRLKIAPLISEVVSPENADKVYRRLADDPVAPLGIVFDWTGLQGGMV